MMMPGNPATSAIQVLETEPLNIFKGVDLFSSKVSLFSLAGNIGLDCNIPDSTQSPFTSRTN